MKILAPSGRKGFTLLELLLVILIISGLAAIAIPQYFSYRARGERAAIISEGRSIYRSFILYYLEDPDNVGGYPYYSSAPQFNLSTFFPLTGRGDGLDFIEFDISRFKDRIVGGQADVYDSPDNPVMNGEFYLVVTLKNDPSTKIFIAQTDQIDDNGGAGGGNPYPGIGSLWYDGVFAYKDGKVMY